MLKENFGIEKVYITGGSSRTVLDHIIYDDPLVMRDLDLAIVLDETVSPEMASKIALKLESEEVGIFSRKDLRPRPRGNPNLEGQAKFNYNAGYGFFWKREEKITDLTIFNDKSAMDLNGILDVDRVIIPLSSDDNLLEMSHKIKATKPEELQKNALIIDKNNGYRSWRLKKPNIINMAELERDPHQVATRIVRSFGKLSSEKMPKESIDILTKELKETPSIKKFQILRNLMKLLDDKNYLHELKTLFEIGFFKDSIPSLHKYITANSWDKFEKEFLENIKLLNGKSPATTVDMITSLIKFASDKDRKNLLKHLLKIDGKGTLARLDVLLDKPFSEIKIGYFTGEFAPFHNGHLNVAKKALKEGDLDFVFVIPTPHATNGPKTKKFKIKEWGERIDFSELGTKGEKSIAIYPDLLDFGTGKSKLKLGSIIPDILNSTPSEVSPWTHIMGGDSLHRVSARGLLKSDPRPRIAVERPGIQLPDGKLKNVKIIGIGEDKPISATYILQDIAAGNQPENINPGVVEKVLETKRYNKIINGYRDEFQLLNQSIDKTPYDNKKIFILDPLENSDGLLQVEASPPVRLQFVLDKLESMGKKTVVYLDPDINSKKMIKRYKKFLKNQGYKNISITKDFYEIPRENRVRVIHSGMANNGFSSGYLLDKIQQGQKILIYETADVPLSPILKSTSLEVISQSQIEIKSTSKNCMINALSGLVNNSLPNN